MNYVDGHQGEAIRDDDEGRKDDEDEDDETTTTDGKMMDSGKAMEKKNKGRSHPESIWPTWMMESPCPTAERRSVLRGEVLQTRW